jgi:transcriptional regulator with XRE-family HTH domain
MAIGSKQQLLLRALQMVGEREDLAHKLGVEPAELGRWLSGSRDLPDAVFLKAVDIVLSETPHRGSQEDGGPAARH